MALYKSDAETLARFSRDQVYQGSPELVCEATSAQDLHDAILEAGARNMPITMCGSQTSMTGASAADSGLALNVSRMHRILDISPVKAASALMLGKENIAAIATIEPGVVLADLKDTARAAGFYYPPDPTSFREACIGSTIATNATGEDTFKYGPTRLYVKSLDVILADGSTRTLTRAHTHFAGTYKNSAGYFMDGETIDEIIGSEGTLACIEKIRVYLLSGKNRGFVLFILPFSSFEAAMQAVAHLVDQNVPARALELIGPGATQYFQACQDCPAELKTHQCFLYIKAEIDDEGIAPHFYDDWTKIFEQVYIDVNEKKNIADIYLATTDAQINAIQRCRHYIPLKVNEEYFPHTKTGGGKVGTDWWVPNRHLVTMMNEVHAGAQKLEIPFLVFAHIGNGHPHWNFLTRTPEEKNRARNFVLDQCRRAARLGGGVAGEHGIGKIKRDLMAIQHTPEIIARMRALKNKWDPKGILGRGNIFSP